LSAVPGLVAKPIIDMKGAVQDLDKVRVLASRLSDLGYELSHVCEKDVSSKRAPLHVFHCP
jgi:GrpB-like predicted nucleotidyltransferase (UPF0157 family)